MDTLIFYVATNGNDGWSGRLPVPNEVGSDGPFATLEGARTAIRAQKVGNQLQQRVSVQVRQGKYYLARPLVLGAQDSGTVDYPIIYQAHRGEEVVLSGGRHVSGWEHYQGGIYRAHLPAAMGGKLKFRQLFCDNARQPRASWPKPDPDDALKGWAFVEDAAEEKSIVAFRYKEKTMRHAYAKPTEIEMNLYAGRNWINDIIPLKSIDTAQRVITLSRPFYQIDRAPWFDFVPFNPAHRYRLENALEDLNQPGEWCLDGESGYLYFWPPRGEAALDEVIIPALDCLIDLHGTSWITISGFTFTETMDGDDYHHEGYEGYGPIPPRRGVRYGGDTIHLKNCERCTIEENLFDKVGATCIYLEGYNARNVIRRNEMAHAGTYGVALVGTRDKHPLYNRIEDNDFHHCGVINKYSNAVFLGCSNMNVVGHNYIHDMPHVAIGLGNNGFGRNIIEYNEIRFADLEISDAGGINSWMEDPFPYIRPDVERSGHIIRNNLLADVKGVKIYPDERIVSPAHAPDALTMAIYLDTCASNCLIYNNIIIRAGRYGIYIQGGRNNIVENNIIIDCQCPGSFSDLVANWFATHMKGFMAGTRFCRNIFYSRREDASLYYLLHWHDKLVEQCDENLFYAPTSGNYDLYTYKQGDVTLAEWQRWGYDQQSIFADPLFVDSEQENFELQPDSPALKLGFVPIDTSHIGIRPRP